jgi:hypothetical protein
MTSAGSDFAGPETPLLFLDFDGCLHHENVRLVESGHFYLDAPVQYCMFQHVALLEQLLEPYPEVRIILSTRWVRVKGVRKAAKELSGALRARVIGSFVPESPPVDFWFMPKGLQVAADVQRRRPAAWFAIDDDQVGWPEWARPHVVLSDPYEGISPREVQDAIRAQLVAVSSKTRFQT